MELITTHVCKESNVGFHGNLFGGTMLAWLDEAGAALQVEQHLAEHGRGRQLRELADVAQRPLLGLQDGDRH